MLIDVETFDGVAPRIEILEAIPIDALAITNSVGGLMVLWGIALLYAQTGALNLAQLGRAVHAVPHAILVASFTLIIAGFFVKAGVAPFHFWHSDAEAVAPAPVCALLAGVMAELGLFGAFRVYWTVFAGAFANEATALRLILVLLGTGTALLGAVMCVTQRHLKRLLAFSTISHIGLMLAGAGTLTARGLAGSALYVLGHAFVKSSLFMGTGIVLQQCASMNLAELRGRGRSFLLVGIAFAIGGLGLAGFPPFGTYMGKAMMEEAGARLGLPWMAWLFTLCSAMTGGAVLRAAARIFLGGGSRESREGNSPTERHEKKETRATIAASTVMVAMTVIMVVLPAMSGCIPPLTRAAEAASERFLDRELYLARVLDDRPGEAAGVISEPAPSPGGILLGCVSAGGAVGFAALSLSRSRALEKVRLLTAPAVDFLQKLHSGHVGDYVAWLVLGTGVLGGVCFCFLR